jgi:hypothetical protein
MVIRAKDLALCTAFLVVAASASAQMLPRQPDASTTRVRLGPLYLNPTIALANLGVDDNVFNSPDQSSPQSDLTLTLTPATDWWLRFGPTWFTGNLKEDLVWYQDFVGQRSANSDFTATWLVPLNRFTFAVGGNYISAKERPGFEIDSRSKRFEQAGNAAVEMRALS